MQIQVGEEWWDGGMSAKYLVSTGKIFSDPVMCSRTAPTTSAATSVPASPATRGTATPVKVGGWCQ